MKNLLVHGGLKLFEILYYSDVGNNDRVVIQELIKNIAQVNQLETSTQRDFKGNVKLLPCYCGFKETVELRWLELVGTIGVSSTHQWVQAIPGLTIFKGVHMYFMFTMDTMFLSIKAAKFTPFHA